ncbi:30S ribosomal protein S20 [Candidatus Parcubacteria bacterium]|nr:30S ribosomal protein S20 [Candidatus Parcubacteria bacterium]
MPITTSAKKALRNSARKRMFNLERQDTLNKAVKKIRKMAAEKNKDARKFLSEAYQAVDKAVKTGLIKANTGARKKSRLSKLVKKIV